MKLFIYPTGGRGPKSKNPYVHNMKEALGKHFLLVNPNFRIKLPKMLVFFLNSFKAEVYVLNWIENSSIGRSGFIGAILSMFGLYLIKLRKAKIVWIFHNIHSHEGESFWTNKIRRFLYKNSTIIISHSQEGADYAKQYASCPVFFKNHPMTRTDYEEWNGEVKSCDLFYWGSILPYKGVVEFLANPCCANSGKSIVLLGKCGDAELSRKIEGLLGNNVSFENRAAGFSEIASYCKIAKYVVFPYIGDSISSSGVLMDTLMMGGTPVGPNRGAFADLADCGCCITYGTIEEVFCLPTDENNRKRLDAKTIDRFIKSNSWDAFGEWLLQMVVAL